MRLSTSIHLAAVLALALAAGGCCTSGQVGRSDSPRALDWTIEQFARRNREDWEATRDHVSAIPGLFAPSVFEEAAANWCKTCRLYFTGATK